MSQWKNTDNTANAVLWAGALVNKTPNSSVRDAIFGNTTVSAHVTGQTVGMFGVDATEKAVSNGVVLSAEVTFIGSGYSANAVVTVAGGGGTGATANGLANSTGRISAINITAGGSAFVRPPTVTVAAPAAQTFNSNTGLFNTATFNANTGVDNTTDFITIASNPFVDTDVVVYTTSTGNTAVTGLTNAASYYVVSANSTGVKLAATLGGANVNITASATSETGHNLKRTGFLNIGSNKFANGDLATYLVAAGNTALTGLTNAASYYIKNANSSGVYLSATANGTTIALTPGVTEAGHSLTGQTATAVATISGAPGAAHAGWILRRVGTGGRAGRVTNEVLVAMGSMTADAEDTILPDT